MWWVGSKATHVYLGSRMVAWASVTGEVHTQAVSSCEEGLEVVVAQCSRRLGHVGLRLWLSGSQCRPFVQDPMPGARGTREVRGIAEATAAQRTGLEPPCEVWIEQRAASDGLVAVAMEKRWLVELQRRLKHAGQKAHSIQPWWAGVLRSGIKSASAGEWAGLAVQDCDSVTVLAGGGSSWRLANVFTPVLDSESAKAIVLRSAVAAGVDAGAVPLVRLVSRPHALSSGFPFDGPLGALSELMP